MNEKMEMQDWVPRISIIIAVYNEEKHIDKCFSSILQQTYQDFEIVVINDGSTDDSAEIIDRYAKDYEGKIISIKRENGGLASARNCGINIVKGKYIAFLDADDYIDQNYLEILVTAAEKNMCDVVCSGQYKVKENGEILHCIEYKPRDGKCLSRRLNISGKLYLTSYIKENHIIFPEGKTYEDNSFNLQAFFMTEKSYFLDYVGYYQVVHEGSITSKTIKMESLPLDEWNRCIKKILSYNKDGVDLQLFEFITVSFFTYLLFVRIRKREYLSNKDNKSDINNAIKIAKVFQKITNENFPYVRKNKYASMLKFAEFPVLQKMAVKVFSWMCYWGKLEEFTKVFLNLLDRKKE